MLVTIDNESKIAVTLSPKTAAGNPAAIDGNPTWTVDEGGDATIETTEDPLTVFLVSGAADVVSTIRVKADADLGEGVRELTDSVTLTVVSAEAGSLGLVLGTAVPK